MSNAILNALYLLGPSILTAQRDRHDPCVIYTDDTKAQRSLEMLKLTELPVAELGDEARNSSSRVYAS